jgi:signal transduction histidine kinase
VSDDPEQPSPAPAARHPGRRRLGLGQRLAWIFVAVGVVAAAATATSVWAFTRLSDARHDVVDKIDPARLQVQLLLDAYVNRETGVRGYVLTNQADFLSPYTQGLADATTARRSLQPLLGGLPEAQHLLTVADQTTAAWSNQFAIPAVAATRAGNPQYRSPGVQNQGRLLFDDIRGAFSSLDRSLVDSRKQAVSRLHQAAQVLAVVLIIDLIILIAVAIGAWLMLRAWITRPLERLRGDVLEVAEGQLDHHVVATGPPELADVGEGVEAMRVRVVEELREVDQARAGLTEAYTELARVNDELARSNVELEQFAFVASHDLQEPLRKITGFTELLRRRYSDQLDDRAGEYMDFAVDGALRMQGLINDLLAFSRVGRTTKSFVPVDLEVALATAVSHLDTAISENGAIVRSDPLPTVSGDQTLLNAVFQNLIGNAIKFRSEAAPSIRVGCRQEDSHWLLDVTDNGIGIEARFAERVFVLFQRLHTRETYPGTGIGLALCKKIVEFHGGQIWVDHDHHPGTRICWTLPLIEATQEATQEPNEPGRS